MRKARDFGKGLQARHQMFYAALSLSYYNQNPQGLDTTAVMKQLQAKYSPFAYVDDTFMQYSFGHLEGYSATYYTYMWSLVIAKDLFSVFKKQGLLNPEPATLYRQRILEPGGSKDAAVMVKDFLGRDYSFDSFAQWLNE
ncbi:protein containing Peptidase M3A and M3B, thimet/oligopeptidase F domain, partial [sediment metagenome]